MVGEDEESIFVYGMVRGKMMRNLQINKLNVDQS
jgi:hypothetical protein